MPTEITLDHNDTPQERAAKVWSAMGFTATWPDPVAKLTEALRAYRDMDREEMGKEMTPLVMKARAELVEARAEAAGLRVDIDNIETEHREGR